MLLVVVGAGAVAGTYYWQQHNINELNGKIDELNQEISKQKDQQPAPSQEGISMYASQKGVRVAVVSPAKNAKMTSPVAVVGKVPGNWSFEASFPIQLKDATGKVVAQGTGQVLEDWMTSQLVWFSAKLPYSSATPGAGTLILQKDNPSGQESNNDSVSIPIQF